MLSKDRQFLAELLLCDYPFLLKQSAPKVVEWAQSNMAVQYTKPKVMGGENAREDVLCGLLDKELKDYRQAKTVERVLQYFSGELEEKQIRKYYFDGTSREICCCELYISEREFYNMRLRILEKTYLFGEELGAFDGDSF